jgi:hypothetical protein
LPLSSAIAFLAQQTTRPETLAVQSTSPTV